jgi:hypothetical protein
MEPSLTEPEVGFCAALGGSAGDSENFASFSNCGIRCGAADGALRLLIIAARESSLGCGGAKSTLSPFIQIGSSVSPGSGIL